ncbi:outer membrane beta-barrel protein [uncultured Christiangramia sp.]|uniref:outer membrane beta-barrel protein n=1 Tax=uncultured Christiangramia sp. TaxID=503836 RepID=UPI002600E355|nr:outer membrane beta-barrel protein [uncultured Christiangramia sp.]|tara:strand:- start:113 stop:481 length:369 start_codon:yes stop_codon:yes gene_type:complete
MGIVAIILISLNVKAQENKWGLEANLNPFFLGALNSESDSNVESEGLSGGYNLGISIKYNTSDSWQVEGGMQYSEQTYNGKALSFVEEGSHYLSELSYIKVPLLINYGWQWDIKRILGYLLV